MVVPGADGHTCEPGRQSARSADGVAIVGFASALAAFTPNAPMLIGARMLPALGGSMIMPCVLGIIRRAFEDETERAWRLACGGTVGAAGAAVRALIGMLAVLVFFLLARMRGLTTGHH